MSFFWMTAGVSRNSWSAASPSASGLSTLIANSSFATDEGKVSCWCRLILFSVFSMSGGRGAAHHRVRAGGCLQSEESDTLAARDSDRAANPGSRSGCLHRCPQPAEQIKTLRNLKYMTAIKRKMERLTTDARAHQGSQGLQADGGGDFDG